MSAIVFAGPTLPHDDVCAALDARCLPPVAQGDVYRAVQMRPRAIGIIDGCFEGVPSVWHKEILFAMAEGIHVFGSASMGALRAAELRAFGMHGVGRIFDAYRDGLLEDDDEVALLHGPPDAGFVALSEPMVNIRSTLERAEGEHVIGAATHATLAARAKATFYQERTWDALLEAQDGVREGELEALRAWLPRGRVDQKRQDALAMLDAMGSLLAGDPGPRRVAYSLEWTVMWDAVAAVAPAGGAASTGEAAGLVPTEHLLDEARLEGGTFARARERARSRALALRECDRRRLSASRREVRERAAQFREARGLSTQDELRSWLDANGLDPRSFGRLMEDEVRLERLEQLLEPGLAPHVRDELRLRGDHARLVRRARRKQEALAEQGADDLEAREAGLTPLALRLWYFERRLGQVMPEDVDGFARERGFAGRADLDRALLREYLHLSPEDRS